MISKPEEEKKVSSILCFGCFNLYASIIGFPCSKKFLTKSTTSNVIDVSGAGDTVVSVAAICMACNIKFEELALLSNIAGGIVCEKVGVVPITNNELLERAKEILDV